MPQNDSLPFPDLNQAESMCQLWVVWIGHLEAMCCHIPPSQTGVRPTSQALKALPAQGPTAPASQGSTTQNLGTLQWVMLCIPVTDTSWGHH